MSRYIPGSWAYYNEFDPQAVAWLRELMKSGHIADGDVDERDMREVAPDDIRNYTQHHFFAGIGGWSLALRLAGWPDERPVLTGSPPCQPFSSAGKGLGAKDERHLAPHFLRLVAALRPACVFGEQVAAAATKDNWLDDLLDALEGEGYATGAIVLPACGVGAPHIRQRLWIAGRLADGKHDGRRKHRNGLGETTRAGESETGQRQRFRADPTDGGATGGLADTTSGRRQLFKEESREYGTLDGAEKQVSDVGSGRNTRGMAQPDSERYDRIDPLLRQKQKHFLETPGGGAACTNCGWETTESLAKFGCPRCGKDGRVEPTHATHSGWDNADWLFCRDGKWRPVESGTFPLAHGLPARVGRLRGYGNAIVPQVAAKIIQTIMEE